MNNISKAIALGIIALVFQYCAEKPAKVKTYDAGVALSVQEDVLKFAIERRLAQLEAHVYEPIKKTQPARRIQAVSASEAVNQ